MRTTLLLCALLAGASCREHPAPIVTAETLDAGDPARSLATCASACARLATLSCPEGRPTPSGASCLEVCLAARASRIALPIACVSRAKDVAAVRTCGVRCAP